MGYSTIAQLTARLGLSKAQINGFIRRGDLHVEQHGGHGRAVTIRPAEAEAFIRFIEATRAAAPDPDRLRGAYCQDVPGGRCVCRCHLVRAGKERRAVKESRGARRAPGAWLPAHDTALATLIATGTAPEQIAPALSAQFSVPRSVHAVRQRIRKLDLSTRDGWVSGEDLIRTLGVYRRRIAQYEAGGLLNRAEYGRWRRYREADVEQLIRAQAGRSIDPRRVKHPAWRSLAEVSAIANMRGGRGEGVTA